MKTSFRRLLLSIFVTLFIASMVATGVFAGGPYTITENTLYYVTGPENYPSQISNGGCAGSYCRYLTQNSNPSTYRWAVTQSNVTSFYAYIPTIGEAAAKYAAYIYGSTGFNNVVVDQSNGNNQGRYVYLGYADDEINNGGYLMLHNGCVAGYWCGGLDVYWDNMRYNTFP